MMVLQLSKMLKGHGTRGENDRKRVGGGRRHCWSCCYLGVVCGWVALTATLGGAWIC